MATEPMSADELTDQASARGDHGPITKNEQDEYDYIMGQIDALLGRLDVQMPIARARLNRVLEDIKSGLPR
jgi:hypothetical protein